MNSSITSTTGDTGSTHSSHDKTVDLQIRSVNGTANHSFSEQAKVSEVISWALNEFHIVLGQNDRAELIRAKNDELLTPNRPLVSYQLTDGEVVRLTVHTTAV
jgi:hypothetical protein